MTQLQNMPVIVEFTATGAARAVASAIERYAAERRVVSALVVPWESDAATVRMAVTSTAGDGWAIEHKNLGTVSLADLGDERTRVVVAGPAHGDAGHGTGADVAEPARAQDAPPPMLIAFARQIEKKFGTTPTLPVEQGPGSHP